LDGLVVRIAARADTPRRVDDPLPWDIGAGGESVQCVTYRPSCAGMPEQTSDLTVRRHASRWDLRHQLIDQPVKIGGAAGLGFPLVRR
jgi:hypothetical protein